MISCRPETSLEYLGEKLSDVEVTRYVQHLDDCAQCRAWLDSAAGDPGEWQSAREMLGSSAEQVHGGPLSNSGELETPTLTDSGLPAPVDLSFLSPSDDPAYVGKISSYLVSGIIGRGGMGVVLKAFDSTLNRNVAIKTLDPALADLGAARQRFAREARAMAAISHEHVIPIYAVDEHRGLPFFAMEYVAGGTLEARLKRQGTLPVVSLVRIAWQVARALGAAHESGLVHRDIKPGNILLDQGTERVRVADFGLVRVSNDVSCTRSGIVAGTPQYMSPEQVRGDDCDGRSDLFSLGSVMYAMAAGHAPFRAETVYGSMHRIVHESPRPLRESNADVPDWLNAFIGRLLEKDRDRRFTSAQEVAQLLEEELAALQNPAHAPHPARRWMSQRMPRWASRGNLVTAAISLITLIAVSIWWTRPVMPPLPAAFPENPTSIQPLPPSTVPLWSVDGFAEARQRAVLLEREFQSPVRPESSPELQDKLDAVRRELRLLEQNF